MQIRIDSKKTTALVLFGGKSVEHDVSIITGIQMLHALDREKFNVVPIYITKDGQWLMSKDFMNIAIFAQNKVDELSQKVTLSPHDKSLYLIKKHGLKKLFHVDFVFSALHGGSGENGSMAGYLDVCDLPYSSSSTPSSVLTYDKYLTKLLCEKVGVAVVDYFILNAGDKSKPIDEILSTKLQDFSFPLIVKPTSLGSSVGITFCRDKDALKDAIDFAFLFCDKVIVETALENVRELNLSIFADKNGDLLMSSTEEVMHTKDFLTFEDKYMANGKISGSSDRQIPANISNEVEEEIKNMAALSYKAMSISGVVRIDYLYDNDSGKLYLNEINSVPGSLANYLWSNQGYSYKALLNKMYDSAMAKYKQEKSLLTHFSSSILTKFSSSGKSGVKK